MSNENNGRKLKGRGGTETVEGGDDTTDRYKGKGGIFERIDDGQPGPIRCTHFFNKYYKGH